MTSGGAENDSIELADLKKTLYGSLGRVSKPSRSHLRAGLKLVLRTKVKNPEAMTFQSFLKGVCVPGTTSRLG